MSRGPTLDCATIPEGERFGCRYEAYLADPRSERMKTRWRTELAIRLVYGRSAKVWISSSRGAGVSS